MPGDRQWQLTFPGVSTFSYLVLPGVGKEQAWQSCASALPHGCQASLARLPAGQRTCGDDSQPAHCRSVRKQTWTVNIASISFTRDSVIWGRPRFVAP